MASITMAQAQEAVARQWKTNWDVMHPGMFYTFENMNYPQPGVLPWARVTLRLTDARQDTLGTPGNRQYRRMANVWVQLFGQVNVGVNEISLLVGDARTIFEGTAYGGVEGVDAAREGPGSGDGRWYEVALICPVTYYETR